MKNIFSLKRADLWVAASMALAASFVLCGYEFIRSAANTLYKSAYGYENLPVIMAFVPLGVVTALFFYGRVLSSLGPRKTLLASSILSALLIIVCYLGILAKISLASAAVFIVREVYIILLIEQYWSFINSRLSCHSGKILNGPICGVASIGSICGGMLVLKLAEPLGTVSMLLFAAALIFPAALLSDLGFRKCGEPKPSAEEKTQKHGHLGLSLFREQPLLMFLLFVVIITQVVATLLSLQFQGALQEHFPDPDKQTAYSGGFFALLNALAFFLQFIGTPLLLRFVSVKVVHAIIPIIHIAMCAFLLGSPTLAVAGAAYLIFKSFDYSVFRAAKEILYIPLSFDARYRAKEVIDVFAYRTGKGATSILVLALQSFFLLSPYYPMMALVAAVVWLLLIIPLSKHWQNDVLSR